MCIALSVLAVVCRSDKDFKDFLINIFIFPCIFFTFPWSKYQQINVLHSLNGFTGYGDMAIC